MGAQAFPSWLGRRDFSGFSQDACGSDACTAWQSDFRVCSVERHRAGVFGPLGVAKSARGQGLGRALLLAALDGLRAEGHVYAFIGDAADQDFYARTCGALPLPGGGASIYDNMLRDD